MNEIIAYILQPGEDFIVSPRQRHAFLFQLRHRLLEIDAVFQNNEHVEILRGGSLREFCFEIRVDPGCLDADRGAFGAIRVMVNCNQTGEAAGTAAYLALDGDTSVAEVDTTELRDTMRTNGSLII